MSDNPHNQQQDDHDPFLDAVAHAYSRQQALEDGVLVDAMQTPLGEVSRQHYRWPIAMTAGVWAVIQRAANNPKTYNDLSGVWHDILWLSQATGQPLSPTEQLVTVTITGAGRRRRWQFKLVSSPDDDGQPCLTVMLPDED